MKKLLLVCFIIVNVLSGYGQYFNAFQLDPKPGRPGHPMKSDMKYAAIFNTPMTNLEEIAKITSNCFAEDSLIEFVQWDEYSGENVVHFSLKRGQYRSKCMGFPIVKNPVILDFNIYFQFVQGQMKMTFADFTSRVYAFADQDKNLYIGGEPLNDVEQRIIDEWIESLMESYFSYDSFKDQAKKDLKKNMDIQFAKYEAARSGGHTQIITLDNMAQYKPKSSPFWENTINLHKANHWVLGVDQNCFDNYYSIIFMSYFQKIAGLINGTFEGVAIDGEVIYEKDADGKVRPVDPKLKKQWIKENRSL